jgi:DNA-binding MarR family transcriptional regulator
MPYNCLKSEVDFVEYEMEELVKKLMYLIPTLEKRLVKTLDTNIKCNLTPLQYRTLFLLHDLGALSMSELSDKIFVSKQQTTIIIDKLIKFELVERILNKDDRRIVNVKISERGMKAIMEYKAEIVNDLKARLKVLNDDEVKKLLRAIDDIYDITKKIR